MWSNSSKSQIDSGSIMPRKYDGPRQNRAVGLRLKRYAKHFERWCRGEQIRSYDTNWLAYLEQHRLQRRTRPGKLG